MLGQSMRFFAFIERFNAIGLAIFLVVTALTLGGQALWLDEPWFWGSRTGADQRQATSGSITGVRVDAGDRELTLYSNGGPYDEFKTDLRFVDSRNGKTTGFVDDPKQQIFHDQVIGPARQGDFAGFGHLGLAKTGERNGQPVFNLVFLRFSDMSRFELVRDIFIADATELDGKTFSVVYWDMQNKAHFLLFDSEAGKSVIVKDLDMQRSVKDDGVESTAPANRFH